MRISDWSSDVCSSDLPDTNSQPSGRLPNARMISDAFYRPDGATSGLLCFRRTLRGPSYRGGETFANPLSAVNVPCRSEEHTSELQSLMRISYAVFCLKKKKRDNILA